MKKKTYDKLLGDIILISNVLDDVLLIDIDHYKAAGHRNQRPGCQKFRT
jgi:hypothetical protein